jgi:hypothetical protein
VLHLSEAFPFSHLAEPDEGKGHGIGQAGISNYLGGPWKREYQIKIIAEALTQLKDIEEGIIIELWIAREKLSTRYHRDGADAPTWFDYCNDIGIDKRTANRWLKAHEEGRKQVTVCPFVYAEMKLGELLAATERSYVGSIEGTNLPNQEKTLPPNITKKLSHEAETMEVER